MKKFVLSIALLLLSVNYINAQSYTDVVWDQIQEAYSSASDDGYSMKNYIIGATDEDEDNSWTFYLNSENEYLIKAFCDEDCDDLDLYLYDEDGDELESDELEDDYPIIYFSPRYSGRYEIEVSMYSCAVEPCYWGLSIFLK